MQFWWFHYEYGKSTVVRLETVFRKHFIFNLDGTKNTRDNYTGIRLFSK